MGACVLRYLRKHGKLPEDDAPADDPSTLEPSVLQVLGAAAVHGRIALGPNAGAYVPRLGRGSLDGGGELRPHDRSKPRPRSARFRRGKLCADAEGLLRPNHCRLHAEAAIQRTQRPAKQVLAARRGLHPGLRAGTLEKLCRYAARPPVVNEPAKRVAAAFESVPAKQASAVLWYQRLSLSADGKKVLYKLERRWMTLPPLSTQRG